MRVSDNTNFGTIRDSINRSKSRMENLQGQSATLKKVNRPSDDPVGSAKVLEVRTDKVNNDQFQNNAKLAEAFLNNTDHALEDISDIIMRAKEIAIGQSSNASSTPESRLGVAEEISQLYQRAIGTANRRIGDRYLFGGYKTDTPPVDSEGNYKGDDGQMMIEIGRETFIGMNVPGHEIFNTQPERSTDFKRIQMEKHPEMKEEEKNQALRTLASEQAPAVANANIFQELKALRVGLLTGDINAIRGTLERFDDLQGKVVSMRSKVGSRVQGIQGNVNALERHNVTNAQLTSSIEDADMAQVVSDLAKEETIFKSSLASSKHLVQPTLLDFLR
ncbi:MAG: flagellar hook-associated protein FlgL [Bdellovibrionales bacterium]|nr:flagellar hook-associated protein FlgL [Bdellovibrionales bacterium]